MWQLKEVTRAPFTPLWHVQPFLKASVWRTSCMWEPGLIFCYICSSCSNTSRSLLRWLINTREHGGHNGSVGTWKQSWDSESCWFIPPNADWSLESLTWGYFSSLSGLSLVEGGCFVLLLACCTTPDRLGHHCYRLCHLCQLFPSSNQNLQSA